MSGVPTTVSIANQLKQFAKLSEIPFKLNAYLFPTYKQFIYPHPKFLVLCSILASASIRNNPVVHKKIYEYVTDPRYLEILTSEYKLPLP